MVMESLVEVLLAEKCSCELDSQADSTPSEGHALFPFSGHLCFKIHQIYSIFIQLWLIFWCKQGSTVLLTNLELSKQITVQVIDDTSFFLPAVQGQLVYQQQQVVAEQYIQIQKMHYHSGNMRQLNNNDYSPAKNSQAWDRDNEFEYAQRSKYEKSEASYLNHQKSKTIYSDKPQKHTKGTQMSQVQVTLPVKIKSTEREDYMNNFKIQLLHGMDKNNSCLTMHITNDHDSLFLWSFYVRESEFLNLKTQQSLRVDFHGFPEVIIEHLNYCSNFEKESLNPLNKNPIFYAVLDIKKGNQEAELKIIQANKYKESLHLSLKFKKANDEQVKVYLSQKYDQERRQNSKLNGQLLDAQNKLNLRIHELEKVYVEKEQIEKELGQRIGELEKREKDKIKELTLRIEEQNMKKTKSQTQRTNRQISDLNDKIQELKNKNDELTSLSQKQNERIINLEASESTLRSKCSMLEQQNQSYEKNNKELKARELKYNEDYHNLKNENTKLTCTIQSLQDKIKEKDQRLTENTEVKSNNYNQISGLEEALKQQKQKIAKLQQKNEALEEEISKLQAKNEDIFNKYQKRKEKLADYKEIISQQEKAIHEMNKNQKRNLEEVVQLKRNLEKTDFQIKDRDIKIKQFKSHVEQCQTRIQDQNKIISELNRRLNQKSIGVKPMTMPLGPMPVYTGSLSMANTQRDFTSTLSSNSQSRMKYSPSPISSSPLLDKTSQIVPPFRKYRQIGNQNDRAQQNSHSHSHSRSPIVNKLNQQLDPEDTDRTKQKIGPIKFKK